MKLQQLIYVKEVARCRSMNKAAVNLYISQPTLSEAIRNLEDELSITIFDRSRSGVSLTGEGIEFLNLAEKVLADTEEIYNHYTKKKKPLEFQISCHHYAFVVDFFVQFLNHIDATAFSLSLKETETITALEDVYLKKSILSVICLTPENEHYLRQILDKWDLVFHPLASVQPYVFLRKDHPLARQTAIAPEDLSPYPMLIFSQGSRTNTLAQEELFVPKNHTKVVYSYDRGTTNNILAHTDCFNVGTGYIIPGIIPDEITALPLSGDTQTSELGWVHLRTQEITKLMATFVQGIEHSLRTYAPYTPVLQGARQDT